MSVINVLACPSGPAPNVSSQVRSNQGPGWNYSSGTATFTGTGPKLSYVGCFSDNDTSGVLPLSVRWAGLRQWLLAMV